MNGYELSRNWFDFAFENNSKVTANHGMLFFWLIEINNRLGWAKEFQITAKECMQGMGCHSHNTYHFVAPGKVYHFVLSLFIRKIVSCRSDFTNIIRT